MATTKSWPGGSTNVTTTTYSIPATGNVNWGALSNFLIALADGAQSTTFQKYAIRKATTTPVTVVAATDCVLVVDLAVAGVSTVNLPAGAAKQVMYIVDGKGDAGTNNITVTPNGIQTIAGSATYVMNSARQTIMLVFDTSDSDWKVVGVSNPPGTNIGGFTASRAIVSNGSGVLTSATTTATEIGYVNGVTSSIQTQLNTKVTNPLTTTGDMIYASNTATPATAARLSIGALNTVMNSNGSVPTWSTIVNANVSASAAIAVSKLAALTVSRAVVTDSSGFLAAATTTAAEIGFVNGVTSAIQTQLNAKTTNPLTTIGDMIYATATATPATPVRLPRGSADEVLVMGGASLPIWAQLANSSITAAAAIALTKLAATTASRALVSDGSGFITAATTTATEIGYVNGVTSAIQTQLDTKTTNPLTTTGDLVYASNTATPATAARLGVGSASTVLVVAGGLPTWNTIANASITAAAAIALNKLAVVTASRALVSDGSGFVSAATTTSVEIGYVNGVTSAIQTQLDAKATNPMTTTGDMVYASNTATPATVARRAIGSTDNVLVVAGGLPTWNTLSNASISASAGIAYSKLAALTSANILVGSAGNVATVTAVTGVIALTNAGVTSFSGGTTGSGNVMLATSPTFSTPVINGFTDASSAGAGVVGQVISTTSSSRFINASSPALGTFYAVTSFSVALTAGDWDIYVTGGSDITLTTPSANNVTALIARLYNVTDSATEVEQAVCYVGGITSLLPLYAAGSVALTAAVSISGTKTYQLYIGAVTITGTAATVNEVSFNEGSRTYKIFGRRRR